MNKTPDDPDLTPEPDPTLPEPHDGDATWDDDTAGGQAEPDETAGATKASPGPSRLATPLALLGSALGAAALLGVIYLFSTRQTLPELDFASPAEVTALSEDLDRLEDGMGTLEATLEELRVAGTTRAEQSERALTAQLEEALGDLEQRLDNYSSLPPRVGNLENAVAAMQGIEAGARDTLLLAEAEYYMQIANSLLTLAGNIELARVALGMADDRLASVGNPALNNVRQVLSDEMTALELTEQPDKDKNAMLLASLARLVDSLPLKAVAGVPDSEEQTAAEEPGFAGRAWNGVKEAFSGAVKVTRPGDEDAPLLMPGTEPLLRANLSLQLQAARLALLKGEQGVFEQSIDDANAWLDAYFDSGSLQVESAQTTLREIRATSVTATLPDISESLELLRQYQSLSEPGS